MKNNLVHKNSRFIQKRDSKMKNEVVFFCRKCNHHLFAKNPMINTLKNISEMDCPNCGEDGYRNWILSHVGDSEKEKENYNWKQIKC